MSPRALLLSSPRRHPFLGHLRVQLRGRAQADVALRAAHSQDPVTAWAVASAIHRGLEGLEADSATSLSELIWTRLLELDREQLGPARGEDLSALVVAWDERGGLVSGCGIQQLWRLSHELLPGADAQVQAPFGQQVPPLSLVDAAAMVGLCAGDAPMQPRREQLAALCAAELP